MPASLRQALVDAGHPLANVPLHRLPDKGLAHDHVRLHGCGLLARVPKQSQMGLAAADNLAYQRVCFERAAASGHTPRLEGVLPPSATLPRGALLVEEIVGRTARLPQDLPALARALAALHALPLPAPAQRIPLRSDTDPLQDLLDEIRQQAAWWDEAGVHGQVTRCLHEELSALAARCAQPARPAVSLVCFDAHPGNFIVRPDGSAVLVDLEKCRYSHPGLDLAHATLYTSTTWDIDGRCVLSPGEVAGFYRAWAACVGPSRARAAAGWHLPLRRAMWLWSLTWCAKWRVLSRRAARSGGDGEDWSARRSEDRLVAHVRERVDHYLDPEVVGRVRSGFDELAGCLAA
ncbi:MAG: aminoglycoside phosphotransferase family protein [Burkholderiales bacterium]|nr:MAG: aminoglycoside phosphotransferase family protein [Burkholderiales bacterium]